MNRSMFMAVAHSAVAHSADGESPPDVAADSLVGARYLPQPKVDRAGDHWWGS
ncbi:hypothetical protein [Streptomyces sp. NPDC088725]|uniref:hypothetical protein n=1 Tax=Streptomyces sp. NPDC088725 TaxID=3365873 RepID=UPI00380E7D44